MGLYKKNISSQNLFFDDAHIVMDIVFTKGEITKITDCCISYVDEKRDIHKLCVTELGDDLELYVEY